MVKERIIILVLFVSMLVILQAFYIIEKKNLQVSEEGIIAKLDISGGIAGMQIEVDYYRNGSIIYRNFKTGFEKYAQVSF
ncbi:MAG: hypothetical protein QXE05_10360, partial [Nitrososphaeria archaeon]